MAESKFRSEGDNHFKYPIQVENEDDNNKQLLQIQLDEQQSQDVPENLPGNGHRDIQLDCLQLSSPIKPGKVFRGEGQRVSKGQRSPDLTQQQDSTDVSDHDGDCFQKANESDTEASSQFIGRLSGTTRRMYPCKASIVATHYRICFGETKKPKFFGHGDTVVVYDPLQRDDQLCPPVLSFMTENGRENESIVN